MKEMIKVYDKKKNPFPDYINRKLLPIRGFYFYIINLWVIDKVGNILIQKRSNNKKLFPNKFECVAGMVVEDETTKNAAVRELREELNIIAKEEQLIELNEFISNYPSYFTKTYILIIDKLNLNNIRFNNKEISEIKLIDFKLLKHMIKNNLFTDDIKIKFKKYKRKLKKFL